MLVMVLTKTLLVLFYQVVKFIVYIVLKHIPNLLVLLHLLLDIDTKIMKI